jgi:hypothetical protein
MEKWLSSSQRISAKILADYSADATIIRETNCTVLMTN